MEKTFGIKGSLVFQLERFDDFLPLADQCAVSGLFYQTVETFLGSLFAVLADVVADKPVVVEAARDFADEKIIEVAAAFDEDLFPAFSVFSAGDHDRAAAQGVEFILGE